METMPAEQKQAPDGNIIHQVEHFRQRYNWDCGVSCVLMLLSKDQRELFLRNFTEICAEEGFGQSTWTIDLCYLLKRFGIPHHMYTTMLGVNEAYKKQGYYNKIIDLDRERVQSRFLEAEANGVRVTEGQVSMEQLAEHVCTRGPAVLLVDAGLLSCDLCKHNKLKAEFRRCFGGAYRGHYIVVVGLSARGRLVYRDPARRAALCAARPSALARAAAARGTDRDTVLVARPS